MNEQLLKMNGLSVGILDALSFESHLGIPLKKNLHYFDKDLLIAELISMTEWLDEQEILSNIALDYRVKSLDSILLKYDRWKLCFDPQKGATNKDRRRVQAYGGLPLCDPPWVCLLLSISHALIGLKCDQSEN